MAFDYTGVITRETNTVVNKAVGAVMVRSATEVNTGVGDSLKKKTEKLLEDIGAPPAIRQAVRSINADIVNAGVKSASDIVQGVLDGGFTSETLKKFTSMDAITAALKRKDKNATDMNNLNVLAGMARTITVKPAEIVLDTHTSPYARDFADQFTPKFKFLFLVEFKFNPPFGEESLYKDSSFHTVIYKFDRPKIDIEHEEVNLYNFTTHVPKIIKYNPVSFTAHDDNKNSTMSVFVQYLRTLSPLFNIDPDFGTNIFEGRGGLAYENKTYSANLGSLQQYGSKGLTETMGGFDSLTSIFKEIRIYHVYDFGSLVDVYSYLNPKISSIQMDDFSMNENETNSITFEIVYDGFYIDVAKSPADSGVTKFEELNAFAQYNLINRDIEGNANARAQQLKEKEAEIAAQEVNEAQIDRINAQLNNETFYGGITDYDKEQEMADLAYEKGLGNVQSLPPSSTDKIVKSVTGTFDDVVSGTGKLFKDLKFRW